jgi:hypothetical protein
MEFDTKTVVLIAGAAVVVFFPQIMEFLKGLRPAAPTAPPVATKTRPVGSEPADWINDLYALQKVLIANGQKEAADLLAQSMVKIIGAPTQPRSGGARK